MVARNIYKALQRKPDIVFGLPSWNEADNIAHITKIVDEGLRKYFPKRRAVIVNVDSFSPDGTRQVFLKTKTKSPKEYIGTLRGKGNGLKRLFEYFLESGALMLATVDADVKSMKPRWVRNLLMPIERGYDHIFPIYVRHEFDASITNHICYPILRGVLGVDLRHPIAGEVALSRRAVDNILRRRWPRTAHRFGVDIFMTLSSILSEMKLAESYLGYKEHKPSEPKLYRMFDEVTTTLLWVLDYNRGFWNRELRARVVKDLYDGRYRGKIPPVKISYKSLKAIAVAEFDAHKDDIKSIVGKQRFAELARMYKENAKLAITADDWVGVIFAFVRNSDMPPARRAKALRPLYFGRFLTFYKENLDVSHWLSERAVVQQAALAYERRNELVR